MTEPLVSVILTTKNEEKNIENCLKSIRSQTYPAGKIEIIVVDNNSSDKTKEIAKKYISKVFNKGPERSAQRNFGMIDKAKGKYVMYLDADMILSSTVIERSVKRFEKADVLALYIPEIVLGNSYWSKARRFERSFYDGTVVDCVRIIKRDVFEKVGGFDLKMTGPEDWDLDKKVRNMGKVAVLDKYNFEEVNQRVEKIDFSKSDWVDYLAKLSPLGLIYHNEAEFNLKKYFQKKIYYGQSFETYKRKWGKDDSDLKKQFGFWYRYFWVFLGGSKRKNIIRFPDLFLGMYFLRFLVGFNYILSKNHGRT